MRDDSEQFIREANVWVRERLREFNRRSRRLECRDMMCGAEDCPRCHPSSRKTLPYSDDVEPPILQR